MQDSHKCPQGLPFFDLSCQGDHGRIDSRKAAVAAISPVSAGLPGARCALSMKRQWSDKKDPQTLKSHTRVFLSSLRPEEKSRSTRAAWGHWSIENRNHHKRAAPLGKRIGTGIEDPMPL